MLAFTFTLTSDELGDTFDGVDLNQFGMQQMVRHKESHFTVRPPKPGVYQLVIYVKVISRPCHWYRRSVGFLEGSDIWTILNIARTLNMLRGNGNIFCHFYLTWWKQFGCIGEIVGPGYFASRRVQSIVMSMSVCLSPRITRKPHCRSLTKFLCMLRWLSSSPIALQYVILSVLLITSWFHIMAVCHVVCICKWQ